MKSRESVHSFNVSHSPSLQHGVRLTVLSVAILLSALYAFPRSACGEGLGERLHVLLNPTHTPSPRARRGKALPTLAQTDRRIEAISKLRAKIDEDIARSEADPEHSSIYLTELAVNKNNGSYPAVGVYRPVAKFYYTYGDREKEPYPNRLLKIVVAVARSDRQEHAEFVLNESAQMVFYLDKKDSVERRIYFAAGRAIRFEQDGRVLSLNSTRKAIVAATLKDNVKLVAIFRRSLRF